MLSQPAPGQQPPDRLAALQRESDMLARQERTLLVELRQLQVERDMRNEDLKRATLELAEVSRQRDEATARAAALEGQIDRQRPEVAARLVTLYKLGAPGYARLLLDADGMRATTRAYRRVTSLIDADKRRADTFRRALSELQATQRTLATRAARIVALQAEAQNAGAAADKAVRQRAALIGRIDARRDMNARLAGELLVAQQKLSALSPTAAAAPASAFSVSPGSLDWPAPGAVAASFGPQPGGNSVRAGIDIAAPAGDVVRAVHEGVVAFADPFVGFGNLVIVAHGQRSYSLYGYLDTMAVARGAHVSGGQAVGSVGQAPSGKPALYFELRIDGKPVDPLQWLKKR